MRYIVILWMIGFSAFSQTMPIPDPASPNTLFLKFSKNLNGVNAYFLSTIKNSYGDLEEQDRYSYGNTDSKGKAIDAGFYTPDRTNFAYIDPTLYPNAITEEQLKAILDNKRNIERDNYLRSFSRIYIIDLDAPNPRQTFKYKIIEVKPYFFWEHN
jgi:hypothetical protein